MSSDWWHQAQSIETCHLYHRRIQTRTCFARGRHVHLASATIRTLSHLTPGPVCGPSTRSHCSTPLGLGRAPFPMDRGIFLAPKPRTRQRRQPDFGFPCAPQARRRLLHRVLAQMALPSEARATARPGVAQQHISWIPPQSHTRVPVLSFSRLVSSLRAIRHWLHTPLEPLSQRTLT